MFEIVKALLDGVEREQRRYDAMSKSQKFRHNLRRDMPVIFFLVVAAAVAILALYGAFRIRS